MDKHYKRYRVEMKEVGKDSILTPELWGYVTEEDVIRHFGLKNEDVEWYKIIDLDKEE